MFARSILSASRQARAQLSRPRALSSVPASSSILFRSSFSKQPFQTISAQRHFSAARVNSSSGQADAELVNKLGAEIKFEQEADSTAEPEWLKAFKADGTFKITDKPGSDEVILTRTFGNEKIRIVFSCSDLERDMEEEEEEIDMEHEGEKEAMGNCRIRTAISIMKSGKGGMVIDATTDGSTFDIDNVSFYEDENLALDESSENDWKRRGLYFGPTFIDLDEELQHAFTEFLNERAIGPELAVIVIDMAEHKEQKEYVNWLGKVSQFIKA